MPKASSYTRMTDTIHAGYRVPPSQMKEIPIGQFDSPPGCNPLKPGGCGRSFDPESYWTFLFRYRLAVIVATLCAIIIIAFVGITSSYLVTVSSRNYTRLEVQRVAEAELAPSSQSNTNEILMPIFEQPPIFDMQGRLTDDVMALLRNGVYIVSQVDDDNRRKRQTYEDIEGCRLRHENCQSILRQMKEITSNVTEQINRLHALMSQVYMRHDIIPPNQDVAIIEAFKCLECKALEEKTILGPSYETSSEQIARLTPEITIPSQTRTLIGNKTRNMHSLIQDIHAIHTNAAQDIPLHDEKISDITTTTPCPQTESEDNSQLKDKTSPYPTTIMDIPEMSKGRIYEEEIASTTKRYAASNVETTFRTPLKSADVTPVTASDTTIADLQDDFLGVENPYEFSIVQKYLNGEVELPDIIGHKDFLLEKSPSDETENELMGMSTTTHEPEDSRVTKFPGGSYGPPTYPSTTTKIISILKKPESKDFGQQKTEADANDKNYAPQQRSNGDQNSFMPTGETMKASRQLTYTPNVSFMPYPVCFYAPPPQQTVRHTAPGSLGYLITSPASTVPIAQQNAHGQMFVAPSSRGQPNFYNVAQPILPMSQQTLHSMVQPAVQPTSQQIQYPTMPFQPTSVPVLPQHVGPTGPSKSYLPGNPGNQILSASTGQAYMPYYCTYVPTPAFHFPVVAEVSEYQRAALESANDDSSIDNDIEAQRYRDIDYESRCPSNTKQCYDQSRCIPRSKWCDGTVDCNDASDETHCSCKDRVDRTRLCDGYFDCPSGEDELGCLGCDKYSFSCDQSSGQKRWTNCMPLEKRCDGITDCINGMDERNCNIITHSVEVRDTFTVGFTHGYLHRNWRGRWYPACTASQSWAFDACVAEIGEDNMRESPSIEVVYLERKYSGPYVVQLSSSEITIVPACSNKTVLVTCPPIPCGTRTLPQRDAQQFGRPHQEPSLSPQPIQYTASTLMDNYKSSAKSAPEKTETGSGLLRISPSSESGTWTHSENSTYQNDPLVGVVGGRLSAPKAWPSLAAIFRDGKFHCAGAILNELWILTAAHCVDGYKDHYYEIAAGILRRSSYSPMEQNREVSYVVVYPEYESEGMQNDVALIRLEKPLFFNRWVRPACLPEDITAGPHWRKGPLAETPCKIAGWGAIVEDGPDPDHLREVELPILPNCKHLVDQNDAEICAGIPQGGRDACQGDSGGPLMCRNPNSSGQWYVAGIVSHGEGCARPNEPGAYTKVGQFVEWITDTMRQPGHRYQQPSLRCPGFYCRTGSRRCLPARKRCDKHVDCLGAEDELHCSRNTYGFLRNNNVGMSILSTAMQSIAASDETTSSPITETTVDSTTTTDEYYAEPTTEIFLDNSESESSKTTEMTQPGTENNDVNVSENSTVTFSVDSSGGTSDLPPPPALPPPPVELPQHFTCKTLVQTIHASKRCDRIVDCEDGTDEIDCTCREYLLNSSPTLICDGQIDCHDKSDEENCKICSPNEFHCRAGGECIPLSMRCDANIDCKFNEDELNCVALTNGIYVIMDMDEAPYAYSEGIVGSYKNGTWAPYCIDEAKLPDTQNLANKLCSYLGFRTFREFNVTKVQKRAFEVRQSTVGNVSENYHPMESVALEEEPTCNGLYLRCRPTVAASADMYRVNSFSEHSDDTYLWPWYTAVFVDGEYRCSAVLLAPDWMLTSSACANNVSLMENYTVALLGLSRSYLHVDGPNQQLIPVAEMTRVKNSDALLLRLAEPAIVSRHVQPIYLEQKIVKANETQVCITQGVDRKGKTKTVFLRSEMRDCPECHRCYQYENTDKCQNETISPWIGTIVCLGDDGWYPAAVYDNPNGPCSFDLKRPLTSIDYISPALNAEMEKPRQSSPMPGCDGFRCPLGKCIDPTKVCDGIPHCRDGSDEDTDHCKRRSFLCSNSVHDTYGCKCTQSQLRCANGRCVPKSTFCDGHVDCEDGSDEPVNCTCAAYLKLTTPKQVCDGRRHCMDKSDESPDECPCVDASFRCPDRSRKCVPKEFLCDGQNDCPSGADEDHCQALRPLSSDPAGSGEVIRRSYGVWHTQCFTAEGMSVKEGKDLCRRTGFSQPRNVTLLSDNEFENPATLPVLDNFHMVRLNRRTWVVMRDDKPLVTLQPPHRVCHRAHLTCE